MTAELSLLRTSTRRRPQAQQASAAAKSQPFLAQCDVIESDMAVLLFSRPQTFEQKKRTIDTYVQQLGANKPEKFALKKRLYQLAFGRAIAESLTKVAAKVPVLERALEAKRSEIEAGGLPAKQGFQCVYDLYKQDGDVLAALPRHMNNSLEQVPRLMDLMNKHYFAADDQKPRFSEAFKGALSNIYNQNASVFVPCVVNSHLVYFAVVKDHQGKARIFEVNAGLESRVVGDNREVCREVTLKSGDDVFDVFSKEVSNYNGSLANFHDKHFADVPGGYSRLARKQVGESCAVTSTDWLIASLGDIQSQLHVGSAVSAR